MACQIYQLFNIAVPACSYIRAKFHPTSGSIFKYPEEDLKVETSWCMYLRVRRLFACYYICIIVFNCINLYPYLISQLVVKLAVEMNGRNRPIVASQRNNNGKMVQGNPIGKAFYQVLQLLHHIGVVKEQAVGNLPNSFSKKTDHLNAFVLPTRPDNSVKATNLAWTTDICRVLLNHYQTPLN